MSSIFLTPFFIAASIINSVFLSLTIWAALQLRGSDWWIVFLVALIMGVLYQVDYLRRKRPGYHAEHRDPIELRLRNLYGLSASNYMHGTSSDGIDRSSIRIDRHQRENPFDTPIARPQTAHTRVRPTSATPASLLQTSQTRAPRRPVTPAFV
ncbi:uncharacterized protein M437DRAFT_85033 [Aureobasidium melanogenum CBS 110374]|uniref:Uncharacterized protein n=1 Tax=Aureobasidium melanogenum (strain CBS 110374) TaxID=1043003 RepID=A0A074VWQ3_AURM1|nr:uncharacterized protein M437DRAFT_85033 [Aureobasidium melanogenum CBS 110374]KEQ62122.1 hypothetical protein M437DRAFT_85033 [Aureobasidium melanogenum CBS 110374]